MPDFLGHEHVHIPQGGDLPAGFTGEWIAAVRWAFLIEDDPKEIGLTPDSYRQMGSWYEVYYADGDEALAASVETNQKYPPGQVWLFEAPIGTVMLPEASKANFGTAISMECAIKTLASKRYRHEFQLISLPAAVAAYATMKGWYDGEFNLSEIEPRDVVITDEFSAKMIGGEYPLAEDEEQLDGTVLEAGTMITIAYEDSILFRRRVALWQVLGEDNPKVFVPIGAGRAATTSQRLSECLRITYDKWTAPIWARVAMVQDPHMDAVSNSGNRLTLPALLHIYESEAEAREAAGPKDEKAPVAASGGPSLPSEWAGWAGGEEQWIATLQKLKVELGRPPIPVARVKLFAMEADGTLKDTIAATAEEALAWWGRI